MRAHAWMTAPGDGIPEARVLSPTQSGESGPGRLRITVRSCREHADQPAFGGRGRQDRRPRTARGYCRKPGPCRARTMFPPGRERGPLGSQDGSQHAQEPGPDVRRPAIIAAGQLPSGRCEAVTADGSSVYDMQEVQRGTLHWLEMPKWPAASEVHASYAMKTWSRTSAPVFMTGRRTVSVTLVELCPTKREISSMLTP